MPVLSQDEKGQVIGHLESVKSISEVAKMFGCTRATIHSLKQKFAATGTLKRKKGSGRKISTTEIQENAIITAHELNHFKTAAKKTSRFKINRVLKSAGIRAQKPAKKPRLADHHKDERLVWCQKHVLNIMTFNKFCNSQFFRRILNIKSMGSVFFYELTKDNTLL